MVPEIPPRRPLRFGDLHGERQESGRIVCALGALHLSRAGKYFLDALEGAVRKSREPYHAATGDSARVPCLDSMASMPKRPRAHELETESRTALRRSLEDLAWVVRPVDTPDYGLDDLVEVFVDGEATGLLFYVQVRGTDEEDLHKALAVRIRSEQQAYFNAVDHPVLVVRYQGGSRRLFARWFHRFDPHPRHGGETLRLSESDELLGDRVGALAAEVRLFRAVSSATVAWPLAVKVLATGRHRASDAAIVMASVAGVRQRYVRVVPGDEAPDAIGLTVELLHDRIVIHGGRSSVTLHGDIDDKELDAIAPNAVLAVGVVLGMMNHLDAGAALIAASAADAPSFEGDLILNAVGILARGRRIADAMTLGRRLAAANRRTIAAFIVGNVAMATSNLMSDDELAAVVAFDEALVDAAEASGETAEAAAICYSLGNWLFSVVHDWERSLEMFLRAQALDPSYGSRDYFMHELSAALFECQRYEEACDAYRKLIDIGTARPGTLARLGDAQLMSGRYADADETFNQYLANPMRSEPVWLLKAAIARLMVESGYSTQERDPQAALELAMHANDTPDLASRVAQGKEALQLDALCPLTWKLIALSEAASDSHPPVAPMIAWALTVRRPEIWAIALLAMLEASDDALADAAIMHALLEHGAEFSDAIRQSGAFFGADVADEALTRVREVEKTAEWPDRRFTLRFPDSDGSLSEHVVQPTDL